MKKSYILIALAMVAALSMVFCECTSKLTMEQKLADSVLAKIDSLTNEYITASEKGFHISGLELTKQEKLVKPDYLLDPSEAGNFVTKSQKINALAIYMIELGIRETYDMPIDETKKVIAKLATELNHPIENNILTDFNVSISEKIKKEYEECKERGDLAYFWRYQQAVIVETDYLLVQNPEFFFSNIKEEQWQAYRNRSKYKNETLATLAQHDEEIAIIYNTNEQSRPYSSTEEMQEINKSKDSAKQFRIANKDKYIARRNALLQ